jgi:hypothetical protein
LICHPGLYLALILIALLIVAGHVGGALAVTVGLAAVAALTVFLFRRNGWR